MMQSSIFSINNIANQHIPQFVMRNSPKQLRHSLTRPAASDLEAASMRHHYRPQQTEIRSLALAEYR